MHKKTEGRRVYPNEDGDLRLAEGDYGFCPKAGYWMARPPGIHASGLKNHDVTEHEDGTITVSPSILVSYTYGEENTPVHWHGFLRHGVWEEI